MPQDLDRLAEGLPDITQRPTLNTLVGGPDYYDPALGRMAVTNPELLAQLLDAHNIRPPPHVGKGFTHQDASQALLNASAQMRDSGRNLDPSWGTLPGVGQNPNLAAQTNPTLSRPSPEMVTPGMTPRGPTPSMPTGAALDPNAMIPGAEGLPVRTGTEGSSPPLSVSGTVPGGFGQLSGQQFGFSTPAFGAGVEEPGGGIDARTGPLPYHRGSQDVSGPTPSPESVNSGGAVPGPATAEKPGDLSKAEPIPAGMRMTRGPGAGAGEQVHPDKTVDGLAKAMAGLQAMTPKPFLPSTPAPYHATNPLARSNVPQALMAEILGAAKPQQTFRLGEALRGRAYA